MTLNFIFSNLRSRSIVNSCDSVYSWMDTSSLTFTTECQNSLKLTHYGSRGVLELPNWVESKKENQHWMDLTRVKIMQAMFSYASWDKTKSIKLQQQIALQTALNHAANYVWFCLFRMALSSQGLDRKYILKMSKPDHPFLNTGRAGPSYRRHRQPPRAAWRGGQHFPKCIH